MDSISNNSSLLEMFGMSFSQTKALFSMEKMIVQNDIANTKNEKTSLTKKKWLRKWEKGIEDALSQIDPNESTALLKKDEVDNLIKDEWGASKIRTWYYVLVLELVSFVPYTPLGDKNDKEFGKCKFDEKKAVEFIKTLVEEQGYVSGEKVERLDKAYDKELKKISGDVTKTVAKIAIVGFVGATAALAAALAAGPIAVMILGGGLEGLKGAALVNACLALIGGGAIAEGGLGVAGGVAIIAGGGGLLGLAGGGTAMGVGTALFESSPKYALSQAAKLETVLKEVVLNVQQDVVVAQEIIAQYKNQIGELNRALAYMEIENQKSKNEIKNMGKSIEYLMKSCRDMIAFTSAYNLGLQTDSKYKS